jgi:plastocyanin
MRRTPHLLLAGALALALPLAACGGGDDDDTTTTTAASSTDDGAAPGAGGELTVHAQDQLKFDRDSYEVDAGEVAITYVNDGSIEHTLLIRDTDFGKLSISGSGATAEGTIELEPGTYEMYCDIAGHEAAGMVADLVVS